jgi:hypothetical protein
MSAPHGPTTRRQSTGSGSCPRGHGRGLKQARRRPIHVPRCHMAVPGSQVSSPSLSACGQPARGTWHQDGQDGDAQGCRVPSSQDIPTRTDHKARSMPPELAPYPAAERAPRSREQPWVVNPAFQAAGCALTDPGASDWRPHHRIRPDTDPGASFCPQTRRIPAAGAGDPATRRGGPRLKDDSQMLAPQETPTSCQVQSSRMVRGPAWPG